MSARSTVPVTFAAAIVLSACTTLLDANFEDSPAGQSPQEDLPGAPVGDSIVVQFGESLVSVRDQQPLQGDNSLEVQRAFLTIEERPKVVFLPVSADNSGRPLFFQWIGQLEEGSSQDSTPRVSVSIVKPDSLNAPAGELVFDKAYLTIEIAPDAIEVVEEPAGFSQLIGTSGLPKHSVIVRISAKEKTYGVTISGEGVVFGGGNSIEGDFASGIDIDPTTLAMVVRFSPNGFGLDTYHMDGVLISQRNG